jgi:hypothetical protein
MPAKCVFGGGVLCVCGSCARTPECTPRCVEGCHVLLMCLCSVSTSSRSAAAAAGRRRKQQQLCWSAAFSPFAAGCCAFAELLCCAHAVCSVNLQYLFAALMLVGGFAVGRGLHGYQQAAQVPHDAVRCYQMLQCFLCTNAAVRSGYMRSQHDCGLCAARVHGIKH